MQCEPLSLTHQDLLEKKFRKLNLSMSEYSFANLYLFRELHRYEVLTFNEEMFIKGFTRDQMHFVMLTSLPLEYSSAAIRSALSHADILFPVPEQWLPFFESINLQKSFRDEDNDYLFALNKIASFPGRHLSKKRNLVKQLHSSHQVVALDFNKQIDDAVQVLELWNQEHKGNPLETDYAACLEAIHYFQKLHLHGRIVYVDGNPAGFTIGEKISTDCYVLHFCKGLKTMKGLDQYLYQDLALSQQGFCSWINLEQDLGIPELRKAKHSYLPDKYILKWRLKL